jgi:hypothetical protein
MTETTLEDFQKAALGHIEGRKTGVTLTWKALSRRRRWIAKTWMREQRESSQRRMRLARINHRTEVYKLNEARVRAWDDLLDRLSVNDPES